MRIVKSRIPAGRIMSEMMEVEADEPGGISLETPIPAASTSDLEETQDSKDLLSPDQLLLITKEEIRDSWSSSLDQQDQEALYIKEEKELDETDYVAVSVKSEYDEENPHLSDFHCIKNEENRDTEASSSRPVDRMETQPDVRAGPERNPNPPAHLLPNIDENASDSCGTESNEDEEDDWQGPLSSSESGSKDGLNSRESRGPQSDRNIDEERSIAKKGFSCSECGKHFITKQSLQRHTKSQVGKKGSTTLNEKCIRVKQNIDSHTTLINEGNQLKCDGSGKDYKCKDTHLLHLSVHASGKLFSCEICGKRFKSKYYARKHIMIHSGQKAHGCDQCGKRFIKKSQLQTHMRLHSAERPFACDECGKGFNQKSHLKVHMMFHSGEKPTVCDLCGKTFSVKYYLKDHMRSHTGERPFACDVCGKTFRRKTNLDLHVRVHLGEKPFVCSVCNKEFSRQGNLKQHMSVHSGDKRFVCSVCSKGFSRKEHLKLHIAVHTGEKTFSCRECGKSFLQKIHLRRHMLIHTGVRPFACDVCDGRFKLKHHLLTHMLSHA